MTELTSEDIKPLADAVRRLAAGRPEKVYEPQDRYEGCMYTHLDDDEQVPGCIIGAALFEIGKPIKWGSSRNTGTDVSDLFKFVGRSASSDLLVRWMHRVQGLQDAEKSWGRAVEIADNEYPEVLS